MRLWRRRAAGRPPRRPRDRDLGGLGRDVVEHLGVAARRIDVVPLGHGTARAPVDARRPASASASGSARARSCSASQKRPHKNLLRLVRGDAAVASGRRAPCSCSPGNPTAHEQELRAEAERLGLAEAVRLPGYVDAADLEGLYAAAAASRSRRSTRASGSRCSRHSAAACRSPARRLRAARGGRRRGALFDPYDGARSPPRWRTCSPIQALAERLVAAGRYNQARFTWERAAAGTLESYERAWAQRSPVSVAAPETDILDTPARGAGGNPRRRAAHRRVRARRRAVGRLGGAAAAATSGRRLRALHGGDLAGHDRRRA